MTRHDFDYEVNSDPLTPPPPRSDFLFFPEEQLTKFGGFLVFLVAIVYLNSVQQTVFGEFGKGASPDTVC